MSRRAAWFLVLAGLFNVVIWPRFALAIVRDDRAWAGAAWSSAPTAFFWVHAVLIGTAVLVGLGVLAVGVSGVRAVRRRDLNHGRDDPAHPASPGTTRPGSART